MTRPLHLGKISGTTLYICLALAASLNPALAGTAKHSRVTRIESVPTNIRVESTPWWPTTGSSHRRDYVGSAACAKCHQDKATTQFATSMAHAAVRAADSPDLRSHPDLRIREGPYAYELATNNANAVFSVSNGVKSIAENLEWALGDDSFGQTYVYQDHGEFFESQLSFYSHIGTLDTTTGHMEPKNLQTAAGGYVSLDGIRQCFGCHFTASTTQDRFDPSRAIPGVTCEACHGPGAQHVETMTLDPHNTSESIMDPAKLAPGDLVDFCGACHRTPADVVLSGLSHAGVINVRLQPYRLEKSKCWGQRDARITCVACHDPHVQIIRNDESYDGACLRCHMRKGAHSTRGARIEACKVGTHDCVNCHMPRVEVTGTHTTFTDHWIRVSRPGEHYPD